jgi:hypothetical protein
MEIFEQFRLILILLMALYSYAHINSLPALPASDDEDEQLIEPEEDEQPIRADDEAPMIEIEEAEERSEAQEAQAPHPQEIQIKQEMVLVSKEQIMTEEIIDLISNTPDVADIEEDSEESS